MTANSSQADERLFDILFVEDEPDDASSFIDSFEATASTEEVHVVSDGDEALDFIHQRDDYTGIPRPDLILLDLHISGTSGEEIVSELSDQPELRRIPVLVLTTSDEAEDIARSYELNVNAYIQKPSTPEEFVALAKAIEDFWLRLVLLPPK